MEGVRGMGDLLYAFTEWLRTTQLTELALAISNHPLSIWIGSHFWAIPIIQTLHILAIAAAFGSVVMINLRILGLSGKRSTMTQISRRYLPWIWWALLVLVLTGIGMVIGEPVRELINPVFWVKMVLVIGVVLVSLWFQATVRRNMARWEVTHDGRVAIRISAVGIILLWCMVMFAGRWIAYAPV
jgi:magnesium-transporting ATPase (P-type)